MGASAALAATTACQSPPADTVVPYTNKPKDVVPGVADYYASTYQEGVIPYGVLVKAREGRPIHIDGNDEHPLFHGKTSLRAQAETIGLYDPQRLRQPRLGGSAASWKQADARVMAALKDAANQKKSVLLLTPAVISPTRRAVIAELQKALPGLKHVAWEPALPLTDRAASEALYGDGVAPRYHVDRARVVASFEADFLGTMGNVVETISGFAQNRKPAKPGEPMSRLYAFESRMSITGSKADVRVPVRPSGAAPIAFAVAKALHAQHGFDLPSGFSADALAPFSLAGVAQRYGVEPAVLASLVEDLAGARDESLVLAGPSLPTEAHAAAALINTMLGAEGHTVDTAFSPDPAPLATPPEMARLTQEIDAGAYAVAVFWQTNPAYASSDADGFNKALAKVPLKISLALGEDETARRCDVVLPINHWLESWNDYEPSTDLLSVQQPLIRSLYDTRQAEEIILGWAKDLGGSDDVETDYREYLMARWQSEVYPKGTLATFQQFWVAAVHDGVLRRDAAPRPARKLSGAAIVDAAGKAASTKPSSGMELLIEPDIRMWDGRYAEIGWLQELPDPITKVSWGNFLAVSIADSKKLGVSDGDMLSVEVGSRRVTLPALVQPGQAEGTVFTVLGYGREGHVAGERGASLFPLVADDGSSPFLRPDARVSRGTGNQTLARTQTDFGLHGRNLVRLWSMEEYAKNAGPPENENELATLNGSLEWPDHKWGMAIDLSACVGCGACQISCQSENNIPVVGPERVERGRIMHWIRSDIYYKGPPENPQVAHQIMLCQQCDDAPCEPVCPVAATVHSNDGLNEQVYNRCIGVRYCSANCPYEVRRFNFFDYTSFITDPLDLAFNPEVTVRPRGVMEKCTFCVQRIRNGVQVAKDEGHPVGDGEIRTACQVACPAEAIVFGDLKDPHSRVSQLSRSNRGYKVLEEEGTRPAITYMAELRNPAEAPRKNDHA
jgi:molybdopterin-containing oxidoreductase family iron-sulfur binding subunit